MPKYVGPVNNHRALIVGRMSIDVLSNSQRQRFRTAGGSGLHASLASSLLTDTALAGITGKNFPRRTLGLLKDRLDLSGLRVDRQRKCNEWIGYYPDLDLAKTEDYIANLPETAIEIPAALRNSACAFVAAMPPSLQLDVIAQLKSPAIVMVDTIRGFVNREPESVKEVLSRADVAALNLEEANLLFSTDDVYLALDKMLALGPKAAIIKLGSEGAIMATENLLFRLPAFNDRPVDTTGAGDSFGGAFVGYLARQLQARNFVDNLAFGEAFLMASVMASFTVEDFGSLRLQTLTPRELYDRFWQSQAMALSSVQAPVEHGRLNGNLLMSLFFDPQAMATETRQQLINDDYFPGAIDLARSEDSLETANLAKVLRNKTSAVTKASPANTDTVELLARYAAEIARLDPARFSYFNLTEAILKLGRVLAKNDAQLKIDPFVEENQQAHRSVVEIIHGLPGDLPLKAWLILTAAANGIELYGLGPRYTKRLEELKNVAHDPLAHPMALDASELFGTRVYDRPQKIAYFTDNQGEADLDLQLILKLAQRYEQLSPSGDWEIGIIPKACPALTDATAASIQASIEEAGSPAADLKKYIAAGKVRVLTGGPKTQGMVIPHLDQETGDLLLSVQNDNGVVISKGEGNALSISGLKIDAFLLFKAKSPDMALAAGVDQNDLALTYLPKGVRGVVGLGDGVRQNLSDVLSRLQTDEPGAQALTLAQSRVARTGETFVDALANSRSSSEPMLKGERAIEYVLPLTQDPALAGRRPIFIARASQPFKIVWDELAKVLPNVKAAYPTMPKIGIVPRYSLAEMIAQMLTHEEAARVIDQRHFRRLLAIFERLPEADQRQIETVLGRPFAALAGLTMKEIILALGDIGIDPRCSEALALFTKLEAEKDERPQDRDPAVREQIRELYAGIKGNTSHLVRPLLNQLLTGTSFGLTVKNKVVFIDEAGSTGSTVISAELLIKAFNPEASWLFYTIQPTKDQRGLFDGDCGKRFKPAENDPKLYDRLFVKGDGQPGQPRTIGQAMSYHDAEQLLTAELDPRSDYAGKLTAYKAAVTAFLNEHYRELFQGLKRVGSLQAREALKMVLRDSQSPLLKTIAGLAVNEEMIPNHTINRYQIKQELEMLQTRIEELRRSNGEGFKALAALDAEIFVYDSLLTLKRWQVNFETYKTALISGVKTYSTL